MRGWGALGWVEGDLRSTAEALAGEGEDGARAWSCLVESMVISCSPGMAGDRRQQRWHGQMDPWEQRPPTQDEGMHPVSDGDKVGSGTPYEDFLPNVSAL